MNSLCFWCQWLLKSKFIDRPGRAKIHVHCNRMHMDTKRSLRWPWKQSQMLWCKRSIGNCFCDKWPNEQAEVSFVNPSISTTEVESSGDTTTGRAIPFRSIVRPDLVLIDTDRMIGKMVMGGFTVPWEENVTAAHGGKIRILRSKENQRKSTTLVRMWTHELWGCVAPSLRFLKKVSFKKVKSLIKKWRSTKDSGPL